jgi:hypothetical protein
MSTRQDHARRTHALALDRENLASLMSSRTQAFASREDRVGTGSAIGSDLPCGAGPGRINVDPQGPHEQTEQS